MKTIELEGIYDLNSGNEFGIPCLLIKPVLKYYDIGSPGEVERIVEDYMIDLADNIKWKEESGFSRRKILRDYDRALKGSKRFKIWSVTIEYDEEKLKKETKYEVIKKKGF